MRENYKKKNFKKCYKTKIIEMKRENQEKLERQNNNRNV